MFRVIVIIAPTFSAVIFKPKEGSPNTVQLTNSGTKLATMNTVLT
jgi:hypothetical protein